MPLYDYQCGECHRHTEKIQKFSDAPLTECPHCGGKLERVLHAPAVAFKGGGWYADGYGNRKSGGEGKSGESKGGDAKGSETKSDSSAKSSSDAPSSSSVSNSNAASSSSTPSPAPAAAPASTSSGSDKK